MTRVLVGIVFGLITLAISAWPVASSVNAPVVAQDDQDQDQDIPRSDEEGEESEDSDELA